MSILRFCLPHGTRLPPQVRTDLIDTNISICSPEVLLMFSDNFDYQSLKRDFVAGTLSEEELGKKIHCHILQVGAVPSVFVS